MKYKMQKTAIGICFILSSCGSSHDVPSTFESLLEITDDTSEAICTLQLDDIRKNNSPEELKVKLREAINLDSIAEVYKTEPARQISVLLRRTALMRRFNINNDNIAPAKKYYSKLNDGVPHPISLDDLEAKQVFWLGQLTTQRQIKDQKSDDYHFRFCVINEMRAETNSAVRYFVLASLSDSSFKPSKQFFEVINRESFYAKDFKKIVQSKIIERDRLGKLSYLDKGLMRGEVPFFPSDPKYGNHFWIERDKELEAMFSYISANHYPSPARKLADMRMIDQSIRKLLSIKVNSHFKSDNEFEIFKTGISKRMIAVDEFNTNQIKQMLKNRGWFRDDEDGSGSANDAWVITQHADRDPNFQSRALALMEKELDAPGVSKARYAYLYDRVKIRFSEYDTINKREQRYGTQGRCVSHGRWEPFPIENPERIDALREEMGLSTLKEYKKSFRSRCS